MHDFGYVALNMKYVNPEDSGTYTCRATNELGEAVTSATLFVQCKYKKYKLNEQFRYTTYNMYILHNVQINLQNILAILTQITQIFSTLITRCNYAIKLKWCLRYITNRYVTRLIVYFYILLLLWCFILLNLFVTICK